MQSIRVAHHYGLENVALFEQPMPTIQANEVLVKIHAVSLNQLDLMIAKGAFGNSLPHVLGSDAAGVVQAVGENVTSFSKGDAVVTHFIQSWQSGALQKSDLKTRLGTDVQGVFAEYIALPEHALVKKPTHLSFEEAATLPIAALTAWEALVNVGQLQAGQTVLIQGTGGVSIFALQFAKAMGAQVVITSGSDEKLSRAQQLGADETINYRTEPNWATNIHTLTHERGVDLALEMSWASINQTIQAMKLNGKIVVIGLMGGADAHLSVFGIMQKSLSIQGIQVGSKESFIRMNQFIDNHQIKPVLDHVFLSSQIGEALRYLEQGRQFGKVVVTF